MASIASYLKGIRMLKYFISPTKTMQAQPSEHTQEPYFKEASRPLLKTLCAMSEATLQRHFKLSNSLATTLHQNLHPFTEVTPAWFAYQGQQFKALHPHTIDAKHHPFVAQHVRILSGLYGLLSPFDRIGLYRLPLDQGLPKKDLVSYWQPKLKRLLNEDTLINLSSKEYRPLIATCDVVYDIDFVVIKDGVERRPSTTLKTTRGRFMRFVIEEEITTIDRLKLFQENGFVFDGLQHRTLKFVKKET